MKILIAPNAFKGTISAFRAAEIIAQSIKETVPQAEILSCPIADGGDGTCELLGASLGLEKVEMQALNALGKPTEGFFYWDQEHLIAYMDVSTVSGIKDLKDHEKNPWIASTYGTGELMVQALEKGAKTIVLGLGGSASVDLGSGILRALGYLFLDSFGRELPVFSDSFLAKARLLQSPIKKYGFKVVCLCDVDNYFFGDHGAIPVFGPQKGLLEEDHASYEKVCKELISIFQRKTAKPLNDQAGFGAAGGVAYGLSCFFPTEIKRGAQWFFDAVGVAEKVKWADLVITGEGKFDLQSAAGKGSYEFKQLADQLGKSILLISSGEEGKSSGFQDFIQIPELTENDPKLIETAEINLAEAVKAYFRQG